MRVLSWTFSDNQEKDAINIKVKISEKKFSLFLVCKFESFLIKCYNRERDKQFQFLSNFVLLYFIDMVLKNIRPYIALKS